MADERLDAGWPQGWCERADAVVPRTVWLEPGSNVVVLYWVIAGISMPDAESDCFVHPASLDLPAVDGCWAPSSWSVRSTASWCRSAPA
ncbi:hypothetical protein AB0M32_37210 [Streptomyces sp. NPDC051985]|uniref:hypothetical protein n=1 Tax=Streptomyces sp. NPDC051985 TaxID=3155807 RepID=UPI003446D1BD